LIGIGRYEGNRFVPYDPHGGSEYFYGRPFHCKALPRARRRLQELSKDSRHGIFISHISEERAVALRLQRLFEEALSSALPVFVSSDYKSVKSGEPWYAAILEGIRRSQVIISLLSPAALDRRWINFEAGVAFGQESRVIPVAWRGLSKGDIGMPLAHLEARDLHDDGDLKALLYDIASICGTPADEKPAASFLRDLPAIGAGIPCSDLSVSVFRQENAIRLAIQNIGNRALDMVEAELLIPDKLRGNVLFQDYAPVRLVRRHSESNLNFIGFCLTTTPSPVLYLGINPLRPILTPGMGEHVVEGIGVVLPPTLSADDEALPVRYTVCTRQVTVGPIMKRIADIPRRA
jgi:hypothetical protein